MIDAECLKVDTRLFRCRHSDAEQPLTYLPRRLPVPYALDVNRAKKDARAIDSAYNCFRGGDQPLDVHCAARKTLVGQVLSATSSDEATIV